MIKTVSLKRLKTVSQTNIPGFVIGTAQLGMDYGVSNNTGKPSGTDANALISHAISKGFTWFDTDQAYGNSENVLGNALADDSENATIVTKLHPDLNPKDSSEIFNSIKESCSRLKVPSIWGVMLHRGEWLKHWSDGLGEALKKAKGEGLIEHIGVSVYDPEEAQTVFSIPDIDTVQLPFNAWSPGFIENDFLERARETSILCFFHSVYLQGLLLMSKEDVLKKIPAAKKIAVEWQNLCKDFKMAPQILAVRYALSFDCPLVLGM
jgi:aryl-alcohol dehydrogenase-like predicted oxidoreductase